MTDKMPLRRAGQQGSQSQGSEPRTPALGETARCLPQKRPRRAAGPVQEKHQGGEAKASPPFGGPPTVWALINCMTTDQFNDYRTVTGMNALDQQHWLSNLLSGAWKLSTRSRITYSPGSEKVARVVAKPQPSPPPSSPMGST